MTKQWLELFRFRTLPHLIILYRYCITGYKKGSLTCTVWWLDSSVCILSVAFQYFPNDVFDLIVLLALDPLAFHLIWPCWFCAPASEFLIILSQALLLHVGDTNQMDGMGPQGTFQGPSAMPSKTNTLRSAIITVRVPGLRNSRELKIIETPKNPIVLAHGLFGFDQLHLAGSIFPGLHYWRGITAALEANGIEVITASVPASGSIEKRAQKLSEDIEKKAGGKSVNIVAYVQSSVTRETLANVRQA